MSPWGWPQTSGLEPAAERSGTRPSPLRLVLAQGDADQFGTPGGVRATHRQGCFTELGGVGLRQSPRRAVVGAEGRFAALSESLQQVADSAGWESELGGEVGDGHSLLSQLEELPPHGDGDRLGHGEDLLAWSGEQVPLELSH